MASMYKLDGVDVAVPQLGTKHSIEPTGNWYRSINATRVGYLIANLKFITWNYNGISGSELDTIMGAISSKLESGTDLISVTSYFPGFGVITDEYYIKAGSLDVEEVGPDLYKLKLEFGQVEGKQTIEVDEQED